MRNYKHYSFDLWLTLIKSNPQFKKERAFFFYKNLNQNKKTIEEVEIIFRNVDVMCNNINQKTGGNIESMEMYLMVISLINDFNPTFNDFSIDWIEEEMEKLFFIYSPLIYDPNTRNALDKIRQSGNSSLNILSNTAFVKGSSLRKLLEHLELSDFFDFQLYSDETGFSKPNTKFFQLMLDEVINTNKHSKIELDEIIHVGDNITADIEGAKGIGIHSFHIHSGKSTILNLISQ